MPKFAYSAKRADGESVTGYRQGTSAGAVASELVAAGLVPITVTVPEEANGHVSEPHLFTWDAWSRRVNLSELIVFSHQMCTLTRAGISIVRAVRTLGDSVRNPYFAECLLDVAANLEAGLDIASSMSRHPKVFSDLYLSLVRVGENTGRLDEAFAQVAMYLELERETKRRIKAATRYPSFVMAAIAIAIVVLNLFVIPAFADVFAKYSAELPWQTQAILTVSQGFVDYWAVMVVALASIVFGVRKTLQTTQGRLRWDRWKLRLPIVGSILERVYLSRFCHTFAMVSRAGVPITSGLEIVGQSIGNVYMSQRVELMRENVGRGESIASTAHGVEMFSPVVLQMMSVGEETGAMDELLVQAARFYDEEVEYELKGLTDALEPVLIVGIAILVLIMALGVFLPMWDLSSVAR